MGRVIQGIPVVPGRAQGLAIVSREPLSFWGGYDQATGEIIDRRHPLSGRMGAGSILVLPFTRGSSTTTGILLESVRVSVAPAGIITTEPDTFLALASIVANEMYGRSFPVIAVGEQALAHIDDGAELEIVPSGEIRIL